MEINPRAAAIAELVLWIGYLQWHFRTRADMPPEPILRAFKNIEVKDAVLAADVSLARDAKGKPLTRPRRTDNRRGERYMNPRRPEWPAAEFIVGNPPFIGGKFLRARLGDERTEALWAAHPHMNEAPISSCTGGTDAAELLTRKGTVCGVSASSPPIRSARCSSVASWSPTSSQDADRDHHGDPRSPMDEGYPDAAAVRIAMTVVRQA